VPGKAGEAEDEEDFKPTSLKEFEERLNAGGAGVGDGDAPDGFEAFVPPSGGQTDPKGAKGDSPPPPAGGPKAGPAQAGAKAPGGAGGFEPIEAKGPGGTEPDGW
jgi:hypothetical protein